MRPWPSCRDASRLLSEAMDSGRPAGLGLRFHLFLCAPCRLLAAQFELIRRAAFRAEESAPPLSEEAKARLRRLLG